MADAGDSHALDCRFLRIVKDIDLAAPLQGLQEGSVVGGVLAPELGLGAIDEHGVDGLAL